jgi:NADH-quinone oxidoreductase subunit G
VAGALPTGLNAYEMFAQPRPAYVLLGIEPELDCHNPGMALRALKQAGLVVMLGSFAGETAMQMADVLLPVAPFSETSGTFVNTEGRVQRFNGVCRPLGESRPGWKVLRVLANVLDLPGFDYDSSEQVRDEIIAPGLEFVSGLDNGIKQELRLPSLQDSGIQRIADVPIYWTDPLVRRAGALQRTRDAGDPVARMNPAMLAQFGITGGALVRVRQGGGEVILAVQYDETVPAGCVRIPAAHGHTAGLGDMFGTLEVEFP